MDERAERGAFDAEDAASLFSAGTFAAQLGNFGIQVTLPLVVLGLSGSIKAVASVTAAIGVADSLGSFLGGWLADRLRPRAIVSGGAAFRGAALAAIPLLALAGRLTLPAATAVFVLDGLLRGTTESAAYTYVVLLAGRDKGLLDLLNSRYSSAFEAGAVLGPLAAAGLLWILSPQAANWALPLAFLAAAVLLAFIPPERYAFKRAHGSPLAAARAIAADPWLKITILEIVLLTLYPLRNALPPLYAVVLFKNAKLTGWFVAAFGIGGWAGARAYRRLKAFGASSAAWLMVGALGTAALAAAAAIPAYAWVGAAVFLFAAANMTARLSIQSEFMSRLPADQAGNITGLERTLVKVMAMLIKSLPALALAWASPSRSFLVIGAVLGSAALLQAAASRGLTTLEASPAPEAGREAPSPSLEPAGR